MKNPLSPWMAKLAPRERRALGLAAAVVAMALLWWLALAPALATLRQAPAQHAKLDAELQHLQTLAAQAQALQSQPPLGRDEALRALEAATQRHLGADAKLNAVGDQATATAAGQPEQGGRKYERTQEGSNAHGVPPGENRQQAGQRWFHPRLSGAQLDLVSKFRVIIS